MAPEGNQANFLALLPQRLLKETMVLDVVFPLLGFDPNGPASRIIIFEQLCFRRTLAPPCTGDATNPDLRALTILVPPSCVTT